MFVKVQEIDKINGIIYLGVQGENAVTSIDIDCSAWLEEYPTGVITIEACRFGDTVKYNPSISIENNILRWYVTSYDTANTGYGSFQIKLVTPEQNIKLTNMITTLVEDSLPEEVGPYWIRSKSKQIIPDENKIIDINNVKGITYLGVQGESLVRDVKIDCSSLAEKYPTGIFSICASRPGEDEVYIANSSVINGIVIWHVMAYDTAISGNGNFQVRLNVDNKVKISEIIRTLVRESQQGTFNPTPPQPEPGWIEEVTQAAAEAKQSAKDIEDLTVSSHSLPPTAAPTVTKTKVEGQPYNLDFGIPIMNVQTIVTSVNGKTGDIVLGPNDIGLKEALESGSFKIPTRSLEIKEGDTLILYGGKAEL